LNKIFNDANEIENFHMRAKITTFDGKILFIPSKIFLPQRYSEKPKIIMLPSKQDWDELSDLHSVEFTTSIGSERKSQQELSSPLVYLYDKKQQNWGDDLTHCEIIGEPQDFHFIRDIDGSMENTEIFFHISNNKILAPAILPSCSYNGEINYTRYKNYKFELNNEITIAVDKHFSNKNIENCLVQWSYLVGESKITFPAKSDAKIKSEILPIIDDFLMIVSFATRHRTVCLGWNAYDKYNDCIFYRGNYTFPDNSSDSFYDELIERRDFESFMNTSLPRFFETNSKPSLRVAMYSLTNDIDQTVDSAFLKFFAAIEGIILHHRRSENLEFVFDKSEWIKIKKGLEKFIKSSESPAIEKDKRAMLYNKLNELNRVSLKESFDDFSKKICSTSMIYGLFLEMKIMLALVRYEIDSRMVTSSPKELSNL